MEAPAKSGGTRKQHNSRNLIGRLSTFPPIQFLKRHNPLRRRTRIQIGFDQPRHEIQELALPLRTAPPSLGRRVQLRMGRLWCKVAVLAGRLSRKCERVNAKVVAVAASIVKRLEVLAPATWEPTQAPMLRMRVQRVRRVLAGVVVCEWIGLVGLCATLVTLVVTGRTRDTGIANLCGLAICVLGLAGLMFHAWHQRLLASWRSLDLFTCGQCGGLRNYAPSLPCPGCNSEELPVFPGQLPIGWARWSMALSAPVVASPAMLSGILLLGSRII